jgi:hypothetical protein
MGRDLPTSSLLGWARYVARLMVVEPAEGGMRSVRLGCQSVPPSARAWDTPPGHTRPSWRRRCTLVSMGENEDDREVAVAKREDEVYRREAALASRLEVAEEILEAADLRDIEADIRDDTSVERDRAADLAAFVQPQDGDSYGSDNPGRRHAALDRLHAKGDRASAADDRHSLTEGPDATPVEPPEPPPTPL